MKSLVKIWIYSNLHIALIAFFLSLECNYIFGIPQDIKSPLFVFFSTIFIYNLGYYRTILFGDKGQREAANWMKEHRSYWIFSMLIALIAISYIYSAYNLNIQLTLIVLTGISVSYVIHDINILGYRFSIRNIPMLKTVIVSAIWALVTVLPQLIEYELFDTTPWKIVLAERFLFILPITLMFDVRDQFSDPLSLKTLPKLIGVKFTKAIAITSLALSYVLFLRLQFPIQINIIMMLVFILMLIMILKSSSNRGEFYYSACFDGLIGIHALVVLGYYWA